MGRKSVIATRKYSLASSLAGRRFGLCGLTLIELLAVIAIVAILATIIITGVGQLRLMSMKTQAASNLRQAGGGILSYVSDQGEGRLPGSELLAIPYTYGRPFTNPQTGSLAASLAPYFNMRPSDVLSGSDTQVMPALVCPGFTIAFNGASPVETHYIQNYTLRVNGAARRAFGVRGNSNLPPLSLHEVGDVQGGASRIWLLTNLDMALPKDNPGMASSSVTGSGWYNPLQIPEKPVFGDSRLRLYLDGRVESVPRDADP